jgi:hypothetical protein
MRTNMVGTHWLWVTRYLLDELEVLLGVEVLHRPRPWRRWHGPHAEAQRRGVVERGGGQVALGVVHPEEQLQQTLHCAR